MRKISYKANHGSRITNHGSRMKSGGQGCSALLCRYTLLEILMVISIMALLMAITMPAFNDMMKGQGVESAARNICQRLKLARSYAISNREYVAVLFPDENFTASATGKVNANKYKQQAMRACLVNSDMTFKRWIPGETWSFLPTGTAIWEIDGSKGFNNKKIEASDTEPITGVKVIKDDNALASVSIPAIVFKSNGATTKSAQILIGEGVFSGTAIQKTNADDTGVNIEINQFTGRVSYGDD